MIFTDVSREKVCATLAQLGEKKYDHLIYYVSRQITSAEINYTVTERKRLGFVFYVEEILTVSTLNESYSGDRPSNIGLFF